MNENKVYRMKIDLTGNHSYDRFIDTVNTFVSCSMWKSATETILSNSILFLIMFPIIG